MANSIANQINNNKLPENTLKLLNERISKSVEEGVTPAVSVAIFHYDSPILEASWGWLDPEERKMPTQPSTLFDLASVTKVYTTVAFLSLVSEELVGLHTPLVDLIPEFGEKSPRDIDGGQDPHTKEYLPAEESLQGQTVNPEQVNCFHLLTHTSGLPPWRDIYTIADAPLEPPQEDPISRQDRWQMALDRLCSYNFVGLPDSIVRYSDIGIMLLGEVVSRLHSSQSGELDKAIKDRILVDRFPNTVFNPMYKGFTREQIAPTEYDATWRKRRVWGEVHDENANDIGGIGGHAGLFSTAFEVALFGNIWLNRSGRMFKVDPELAGASIELQAQTGAEVRGLGWMLKSPQGSSAGDKFSPNSYGHTGFTGTSLWIDPREKLVVSLLTNRVYPGRDKLGIYELRRDVHDIIADWVQN